MANKAKPVAKPEVAEKVEDKAPVAEKAPEVKKAPKQDLDEIFKTLKGPDGKEKKIKMLTTPGAAKKLLEDPRFSSK